MRSLFAVVFACLVSAPGCASAQSAGGWDRTHRDYRAEQRNYEGHDAPHPGQHFDSWSGHYVDNDGFQPGNANGN